MARLILGLNSDHADAAAALVADGVVLAAIAEERITRRKHSAEFPSSAIAEVLRIAGRSANEITDIAVARKATANMAGKLRFMLTPNKNLLQIGLNRFKVHHKVSSLTDAVEQSLGVPGGALKSARIHRVEHHVAHVASSFYLSPFERAVGLSVDGAGDFASTMMAVGEGNSLSVRRRTLWPHSLGVFYTALCQLIGFDRYGEEYKVMGLAAYGVDRYAEVMNDLVRADSSSRVRLSLNYFRHHSEALAFQDMLSGEVVLPPLFSPRLEARLGPPLKRGEPLTDRERDIAASVQARYETVFLQLVKSAVEESGCRNIVLAGGCALNSVANGKMITGGYVDQAYGHSAASDDGTAVGAALYVAHGVYGLPRESPTVSTYWGPEWTDDQIQKAVNGVEASCVHLDRSALLDRAARAIASGKIVGWFQGREEWGPRALGNRSILCNPQAPNMKAILNDRIKNREPFRPFAPSVREEDLSRCFIGSHSVPFMNVVYLVRPEWRARLAAVTHEDDTARVHSVTRQQNPVYYDLISAFNSVTGIPVLLNTSFNENEPIVHRPEEAVACFSRTRMDCLGIGPFWLQKDADRA